MMFFKKRETKANNQDLLLEEQIHQAEREARAEPEVDQSRRRFLGLGLKGLAAAAILSNVPDSLVAAAMPSNNYDLALKEYSSLKDALIDFETVQKDANVISGNFSALRLFSAQENEVTIEPFYAGGKVGYRAVLNLKTQDASLYKHAFDNANHAEPIIGKYAAKVISAKRDESDVIIHPLLKEGRYISFSSDKEEESLLENIATLRKSGVKRLVLHYDKEDGFVKTLVGRFGTQEAAVKRARELLQNDAVLDTINSNELGIIQATMTEAGLEFEWDEIVKEVKILDKKDTVAYEAVKKRVAKRNIATRKEMHRTYEMDQIESIIYSAVDAHNRVSKTKVDPALARAIAFCESTYNPRATGYAIKTAHVKTAHGVKNKRIKIAQGRGLFQMMPATAKAIGGREFDLEELFDPEVSAKLGVKYLAYLLESRHIKNAPSMTEKLKLVIAAYNGGEPSIYWSDSAGKNGKKMRAYENPVNKGYGQTRDYVRKVGRQYEAFAGRNIF